MECNTVERAIKTEIDARTELKKKKRVGKLGWFMSDINHNMRDKGKKGRQE